MQSLIGSTNKLATLCIALMATICLPRIGTAQDARDMFSLFRKLAQTALVKSAQRAWSRLSDEELTCLNKALASRGTSIGNLVRRGVQPGDPNLSSLRASCGGASTFRTADGNRPSVYVVDGLALGGTVQPDSSAYREYQCAPSEQFSGYTWCRKKTDKRSSRGQFSSSNSILHSQSGVAHYVNRFLEPAWFSGNEANEDINRLSKKYGQPTRIIPMPRQSSVPNGMIVTWGNVALEPLNSNNLSELAAGRDVHVGFMIDHIGNFQRSAQQGLPIYRISGGAGYVWAASWNDKGIGTLRFLAADPSAIDVQPPAHPNEAIAAASKPPALLDGPVEGQIISQDKIDTTARSEIVTQPRRPAKSKPDSIQGSRIEATAHGSQFEAIRSLVGWIDTSMMSAPDVKKAFSDCQNTLLGAENNVLAKVDTAIQKETSRTTQEQLITLRP